MGHLLMPGSVGKAGDFKKGVISFWFRLPAATVAAVRAMPYDPWPFQVMTLGVIPLVTWGEQIEAPYFTAPGPMAPSYIGVRVGSSDFDWGMETLEVNLQTPDEASGSGDHWAPSGYPEWFGNATKRSFSVEYGFPKVLVDHWNHIILSWDMSESVSTSGTSVGSAAKLWCSINDENKKEKDLPAEGPGYDGGGPNDMISATLVRYLLEDHAASVGVSDVPSNPFAIPSRVLSYTTDPSGGRSEKHPVKRVEMAELQVFAGVTVDTDVTANRRAFVDSNGRPVSPAAVDGDGNPIGSVGRLGKQPEILLLGANDWAIGYNSGSLSIKRYADGTPMLDDEGKPIRNPAGQFTPTGKILSWEPGPSLHGPQNPAPPPGVRLTRKPVTVP